MFSIVGVSQTFLFDKENYKREKGREALIDEIGKWPGDRIPESRHARFPPDQNTIFLNLDLELKFIYSLLPQRQKSKKVMLCYVRLG